MERKLSIQEFKKETIEKNELLGKLSLQLQEFKLRELELAQREQANQEKSDNMIRCLKTRLGYNNNEIKHLKERNEMLNDVVSNTEKNYTLLSEQHEQLKSEFDQLQLEVNKVQLKYQSTNQELTQCKEKLNLLDKFADTEQSLTVNAQTSRVKKKGRKKLQTMKPEKDEGTDSVAVFRRLRESEAEKEKLSKENMDFKQQVNELKKKHSNLKSTEDSFYEGHMKIQKELSQLKNNIEEKNKEIAALVMTKKNMESQKDRVQADNEKLTIENSLIQQEMCKLKEKCAKHKEHANRFKKQGFSELECKLTATIELKNKEIDKLSQEIENFRKNKNNFNFENHKLRHENHSHEVQKKDACNEEYIDQLHTLTATIESKNKKIYTLRKVEKLKKEKDARIEHEKLKNQSSVLQPSSEYFEGCSQGQNVDVLQDGCQDSGNSESISTALDEISNISPNAPVRETSVTPTDEEICAIMKEMVGPAKLISPMSEDAPHEESLLPPVEQYIDLSHSSVIDTKNNSNKSTLNIDLKETVIKRRKYMKQKRLLANKRLNQVDIYGTLLALQKANIGFIITNNALPSALNLTRLANLQQLKNKFKQNDNKKAKTKKSKTVTQQLQCSLPCCSNTYMVLKECSDDEETQLVGFVGVKNESPVNDNGVHIVKELSPRTCMIGRPLSSENGENCENTESVTEQPIKRLKTLNHHHTKDAADEIALEIRKSKRKVPCNSFASMVKKKLAQTEHTTLHLGMTNVEKNIQLIHKPVNSPEPKTATEAFAFKKPDPRVKSPRASFKRPVCGTRRSRRLSSAKEQNSESGDNEVQDEKEENEVSIPLESPKSPTPDRGDASGRPVLIPLEKSRGALDEVVEFSSQESNLDVVMCEEGESFIHLELNPTEPQATSEDVIFKKPDRKVKSLRAAFKRPVCSTRRSRRLALVKEQNNESSDNKEEQSEESTSLESPKSPTPDREDSSNRPVLIPLEKNCEPVEEIPTTKIGMPSSKPIPDSEEEGALNETVETVSSQESNLNEAYSEENEPFTDLELNHTESKATTVKPPRASYKRPVCSTRRSRRLASVNEQNNESSDNEVQDEEGQSEENIPLESPKSPTPESTDSNSKTPALIPLEKSSELPTTKIEVLFSKLIQYSEEEEALNEVVKEFSSQDPEYITEAILERISVDYHDPADTKYHPAPLMTHVQRTMLGFMSKLEKTGVRGVFDSFLSLAERRLLMCDSLQELFPITRLYLAVCKLEKKLTRMRKMCCDVFYFCGDLALPFFFTVLTSWTEVLPHARDARDFPLARVLVQIVYTRNSCKPGYNLMPLRDLLIKFYGYPSERWDYDEFFKDLFNDYLRNPSRLTDFPLILYCKSRPEKWVYEKIDKELKPMVSLGIQDNFKATLVILIGNLYNRFSSKSEDNYLPRIRQWLSSLIRDETPEVVKRCVYISLNRLKKK